MASLAGLLKDRGFKVTGSPRLAREIVTPEKTIPRGQIISAA
jgi:hypothetical protein